MRSVAGWIGALWLVAGCTVPSDVAKTCTSNEQCGQGGLCDTSVGLCYAAGTEPELDGGSCTPACAAYEACTASGCRSRFTALNILSPANNAVLGGGTVQVSAQFVENPTYASTTQFPDTLVFGATRSGAGDAGSFGAVTRSGDTYTVPWTLPGGQAQITLTASHPTPAAGLSAAVNVQVDTVPPTFTIAFSNPPARSSGSGTQADERDPTPGYDVAFRREESVTVSISADEPVNNVTLTVVGIGPGGTAGQAQAPVPVQPGGTCNGSPAFCGNVTVDLSTLDMRDVRGSADFQVAGVDAVGNRGTKSAGLKVTRWKWAFDAAGPISGSPAVGTRGVIYFGTNITNGTGKMFAVKPDGTSQWAAPIAIGDISGSPAVGAFNANEEYVYVAARNGSGPFLYALRGSDGSEKFKCAVSNVTDVPGSLAVGTTPITVGTAETGAGVFVGSQVHLVGTRPDAPLSGDKCIDIVGAGPGALPVSVPGGSFVMKDQNIFFGTTASKLASYDMSTGTSASRTGWPVSTNSFTRGIALLSDQVYGAASNSDDPSLGSLFSVPVAGGTSISFVYPQANTSRVFNLAIGSGNTAYFGAETATTADLLSLALGTTGATPTKVSDVGVLRGAPVVGKNDRLYTLNSGGKVSVWIASSLAPVWNADLALDLSTKDTSATLDCRRDASGNGVAGSSLGNLYFASGSKLYAFIVDSPGMDPNAPWPKFQHDARNTGNPATPITNCP
jgi:hypothetical protein